MSRSLVHEATSDDQNPPSGYVLKELAQKTLTSPADSSDILSYLLKRLDKDSPDVRLKALLAIKYVCQNGRDDFRLALQRNNEAIRACSFYKGPLDPLRGDAPYQKVRDAAKDTIAAVYDNSQRATQASVASRIKGMGGMGAGPSSSPVNDSFGSSDRDRDRDRNDRSDRGDRGDYQGTYSVPKLESGAYSTGRMQGFGNPAFEQHKPSKPATNYREFVRPSGYNPETSSYNPDNTPAPASADVSKPRTRGAVGGVWASDNPSPAAIEQKSSSSYSTGSTFRYDSGPAPAARPTRTTSASSGEYEGRLVDQITAPSGVRVTPTKEELKAFTDKARSLDPVLLAQLLQNKFRAPAYQTTLKALCVVEALVQGDFPGVVEFFRNENDGLIELETHTHKQVGSKASQILVAIGLKEAPQRPEEPAVAYVPTSSAPARGSAVADLISFDEPAASPSPVVAAPIAATSAPASSFDFLSGSSASPAAAPAPVAANGGVVKLFSDLTIKPQQASPAAPAAAQRAPAGQVDPLTSIFGDALPAAKPQNNHVDDLIKSKQAAYPAPAPANPYGLPVTAAASPYGMAPAQPVDPFFGAGFPVASTGTAFNGVPVAQAAAFGMPVVPTAVPMGYYNYPGAVGVGFPGARPNPMAAPLPDFQVREAGPKQVRRDFIGDPLAPAPPQESQSGFAFTQKADAFDFVQDHLKQST